MVTWQQIDNDTWDIYYKGIEYRVHRYYGSGFVIRNIEGIFSSRQDIDSYLILHY
jgi:hypothetical protein